MIARWASAWRYSIPMLVLALALIAAIVGGYWAALQNREAAERSRDLARQVAKVTLAREMDARQRRRELNLFLEQLCIQDAAQGAVLISILRQSPLRRDPAVRVRYDAAIRELLALNERCNTSLPVNPP